MDTPPSPSDSWLDRLAAGSGSPAAAGTGSSAELAPLPSAEAAWAGSPADGSAQSAAARPLHVTTLHRLPSPRPARWVALAGWLIPGGGQWLVGRWGAGLVLLLVIGLTFAGGLALTDFTCVDPRTYELEFVAHALIGGPTALTVHLTRGLKLQRMPPGLEVGRLFVVVAGFLNTVAMCDAVGERWRRNARLRALAARQQARQSRDALAAPPWGHAAPASVNTEMPTSPTSAPGAEPLGEGAL